MTPGSKDIQDMLMQLLYQHTNTVDYGYSHTKYFWGKCDYKQSVTVSGALWDLNFRVGQTRKISEKGIKCSKISEKVEKSQKFPKKSTDFALIGGHGPICIISTLMIFKWLVINLLIPWLEKSICFV